MKNKKLLSLFLVLLLAVVLVSCKKKVDDVPVFTGVTDKTIEVGEKFDPMTGVTATDKTDGDLTSKIVVTGTVDVDKLGDYTLTYKVENSAKKEAKATRKITVITGRLYANGKYNFKFESSELRHTFFGAAEKHLLDNVYGGVPLFVNSGMSIYSDRVQLPVKQYVPIMGWGTSFGDLSKDDSQVKFSGGTPEGVGSGTKTYRGSFSSNPTTFNQWISDDSVSSDATAYMLDSLYAFEFNDTKDGYELNGSMAADNPQRIGGQATIGTTDVATKWEVPIKEGLKWGFHPDTLRDFPGLETDITAKTFVDTFKYALDQGWFRARAGGSHFWAQTSPVKGAKEYYDAMQKDKTTADFDNVGLSVSEDGNSIIFEFTAPLSEWNLKYWLSSDTMTPVHLGLLGRLPAGTAYGTSPATMAYTGPYILQTYEPDKLLHYVKNDNFHSTGKYNYTGYHFSIIERSEIVFAEFEAGHLDGAGIPLTKYGQYKDNPGVRRTPGSTTFRMNINGLGSVAEQRKLFPDSTWTPVPILANLDFRKALYFGVDRKTLAHDVLKTSDPGMYLFSNAYLVDPETGQSFRDTEDGEAVGKGLSTDTYGYNAEAAEDFFLKAVQTEIDAGRMKKGDTIELEVAVQAASTAQQQLGDFVKNMYESAFVDKTNNVKVKIKVVPVAFPDIYYTKQLVGEFDLGMGGISGSTLDAASFLEVFSSDNRGGFTLNWGFDTSVANIPVTYTNAAGEEIVDEYWSFDAIVTVLNGEAEVVRGVEAVQTYDKEIAAAKAAIDKIPTAANTKTFLDAVAGASTALGRVPEALRGEVTNLDKYTKAKKAADVFNNTNDITNLDLEIAKLPALVDLTVEDDLETVQELLGALNAVEESKTETVKGKAKLLESYEYLVNKVVAALDPVATAVSQKAVRDARALVEDLAGYAHPDKDKKIKPDWETLAAKELAQAWAMVNAIPAFEALETKNTKEVNAARAAVKEFFDLQDELTPGNANRLLPVLKAIAEMMLIVDAADVKVVDLLILTLPADEDSIELVDRFAIADVRATVKALQARVENAKLTNLAYLENAEKLIVPLIAEDDAINFYWLAQELPPVNSASDLHIVQVEAARAAYDKLSKEAKAIVDDAAKLKALLESKLEEGETITFKDPVKILTDLEDALGLTEE